MDRHIYMIDDNDYDDGSDRRGSRGGNAGGYIQFRTCLVRIFTGAFAIANAVVRLLPQSQC